MGVLFVWVVLCQELAETAPFFQWLKFVGVVLSFTQKLSVGVVLGNTHPQSTTQYPQTHSKRLAVLRTWFSFKL